ncbi:hypothetical protein JTB14_032537 [Gonioctena quinquepunctata]|nr:hypothetical protein JTB14_032537 [Gonioctena quinquepunctata]
MEYSGAGPSQPKKKKSDVKNPNKLTDEELFNILEWSDSDLEYNLPSDDDDNFKPDYSGSEESSDDDGKDIINSPAQVPFPGTANNDPVPTWSDDPEDMKNFPFSKINELLQPIPGNGDPIDYFRAIFDDNILDLIVRETNNYAEQVFLSSGVSKNTHYKWKPVNLKKC